MATGGDVTLKDSEIERLARIIIAKHMATIAMKDLGIGYETIENLKIIKTGRLHRIQQRFAGSVEKQEPWNQPGRG